MLFRSSLEITGSIIKFVSPGMSRKMYGKFLMECIPYVGMEKKLSEISSLFSGADYMWNKFAARIMKKDLSVEERMNGKDTIALLDTIKSKEEQAIEGLKEVFAA